MRNYNSHLSDDSYSTGVGQTVKTIKKLVDPVKSFMGKDTDTAPETNESVPEYSQPSIIRQAPFMVEDDVLSGFYRQGRLDKFRGDPVGYDFISQANTDLYVLNNYSAKISTATFDAAPG